MVKPPTQGQVLKLDLAPTLGHEQKGYRPVLVVSGLQPQNPKLADILAKAQESLSGLNQDQYWAEREQELAAGRASWEAMENGSWRG